LIYALLAVAVSFIPVIGGIISFIISPALVLGMTMYFLKLARGQEADFGTLFEGFSNFVRAFCLNFMVGIFIFLWSLLLIVPGFIAALKYSMVYYILADNPQIGVFEAIRESKRITDGHKWELFVLYLSFLGWMILGAITFGVGYLYVTPYMTTTIANFYDKIKGEPVNENPFPNNEVPVEM